jgi:hypothetical protein
MPSIGRSSRRPPPASPAGTMDQRESAAPVPSNDFVSWAWERGCFLSFAALVFASGPSEMLGHLTTTMTAAYLLYFGLDKASPRIGPWISVLHGLCLNGSLSVLSGFTVAAAICSPHYGGFVGWLQELDRRAAVPPRSAFEVHADNVIHHIWPFVAMQVDLALNWSTVRGIYHSCGWRTAAMFLLAFPCFASIWQNVARDTGLGEIGYIYAAPAYLEDWSTALAGTVRITRADLVARRFIIGTDFVFAWLIKFFGTVPALLFTAWFVTRIASHEPYLQV